MRLDGSASAQVAQLCATLARRPDCQQRPQGMPRETQPWRRQGCQALAQPGRHRAIHGDVAEAIRRAEPAPLSPLLSHSVLDFSPGSLAPDLGFRVRQPGLIRKHVLGVP